MPGTTFGPKKPYLSIAQGAIRLKVAESTEGAIRRDYEMKDGTKGFKYELVYKSWDGKIVNLNIKNGKFGETCEIEFEDAVLSLSTKSRYFMDLVKRLMNVNINQTLSLTPYDFEVDGKQLVGISVTQRGEKIPNYYWDTTKEKVINGFPIPDFNTKQAKTRDWEKYWLTVQEFLVSEIEKIKSNIKHTKNEQQPLDLEVEESSGDMQDTAGFGVEEDTGLPEEPNEEEVEREEPPF